MSYFKESKANDNSAAPFYKKYKKEFAACFGLGSAAGIVLYSLKSQEQSFTGLPEKQIELRDSGPESDYCRAVR